MSAEWHWPKFDLRVTEERRGLKVDQRGTAYLAKGWRHSDAIKDVFELAFLFGLTSLWQKGHPSETKLYETGSTVDYISFSRQPDEFWVFALDMDSCAQTTRRSQPERVKFRKIYRHILRQAEISCIPEWRSPQNLHVALADLKWALKVTSPYMENLGLMKGRRLQRGLFPFFVDEEDLHSHLLAHWDNIEPLRRMKLLASKRLLGGIAHRNAEVDLIAEDEGQNLFIIELKDVSTARADETPVQQLERYMRHPEIIDMAAHRSGSVFGILIAQDLMHETRKEVASSELPIAAYEISKTERAAMLEKLAVAPLLS